MSPIFSKDENKDELRRQLIELYDCYRTSILNRKYYGHRLARTRLLNRTIEIILAISAASAVGAWALWQTSIGTIIWETLFSCATIIAVINPFLKLNDEIERYVKLYAGHSTNIYLLKKIVSDIARTRRLTTEQAITYSNILDSICNLAPYDDPKPKSNLISRYFDEVNKEVPPESLWMPA